MASWWFQPIAKVLQSNWTISPSRDENEKYLKPPSRWLFWVGHKFFYHGSSLLHFQAYKADFNNRKRMAGQHAAALCSNGEIHMSLCPAAWRITISRRASWQERWHKQGNASASQNQVKSSTSRTRGAPSGSPAVVKFRFEEKGLLGAEPPVFAGPGRSRRLAEGASAASVGHSASSHKSACFPSKRTGMQPGWTQEHAASTGPPIEAGSVQPAAAARLHVLM